MAPTLTWERLAHHSHLEVLPVLGGLAIVMGVLGVLGIRSALTGFLPLALVGLGSFVLVGSISSYMCLPARVSRLAPVSSPIVSAPPRSVPPSSESQSARSAEKRPEERVPHSGIGRATLVHLTQVEDELWRRWASPPAASLGAPVVGPVASTAYSPPKAGAFVAFPQRDRDAVVISSKPVPKREAAVRTPEYPGPAGGDIVLRRWADEPPPFLTGRGGMLTLDVFDHPVDLDAVSPTRPRLGPAAPVRPERTVRSSGARVGEAAMRRLCGECSRRLTDFRSWVECRFCRKPLCRQCLQESFEGAEVGACMECRAERARSYRSGAAPSRRPARSSRPESAATP